MNGYKINDNLYINCNNVDYISFSNNKPKVHMSDNNSYYVTQTQYNDIMNKLPDEYIIPIGKITLTDTSEYDVTQYATAQIVDGNLLASNIKKGVTILGIKGTLISAEDLYGYELDTTDVEIEYTIPSVTTINDVAYDLVDNVKGLVKSVNGKTAKSINLLNPILGNETTNGVTCTNNGDGTYTLNGTATKNTSFVFFNRQENKYINYKLLGCPEGGAPSSYRIICTYYNEDNTFNSEDYEYGSGIIIKDNSKISVEFYIRSDVTLNNIIFKPMITKDTSLTYNDFVPYFDGLKSVEYERLEIKGKNGEVTSTLLPYPTTLKGVGTARDTLEVVEQDNGLYTLNKVVRIGEVDLGTLNWAYARQYSLMYATILNKKDNSNQLIISKGNVVSQSVDYSTMQNGDCRAEYYVTPKDIIYKTNETNPATFKQAMQGVMLIYELTTPTTEVITTDLTKDEVMALLEQGGSVEVINSNSDFVNGSTTMKMVYKKTSI